MEEELRMSSTKMYICLNKFITEFKKSLEEFKGEDNQSQYLSHISKITKDLR
jgi:hypothetical protein